MCAYECGWEGTRLREERERKGRWEGMFVAFGSLRKNQTSHS